jgi:Uri superfamily endonuclease
MTDKFIEKATLIHGDLYDYSKIDYKNANTKVTIICKKHGEFQQISSVHIQGFGCSKCSGKAKLNTEEFIKKATLIHGDKYDYSKVDYKNTNKKVIIICKKHKDFLQIPTNHLKGQGCNKCGYIVRANKTKTTNEEFIKKAKLVHNDKYDYSKVDYKNSNTRIIIICKEHGEFLQIPSDHLSGFGCAKCSGKAKLNIEEFIEKAKLVHNDIYNYSNVDYKNSKTKIIIICKEHGEFLQIPSVHLLGFGCAKCSGTAKSNTNEFIENAILVHGDKYDYSKVNYIGNKKKVTIICKEHGEFLQIPNGHLNKQGCPKCANKNITTEEFIEKSKKIHGDLYDYSKVNYIFGHNEIIIVCKIHGEFQQKPRNHINGHGCSKCGGNLQYNTEDFIKKSILVHGDKYDYSKVDYKKCDEKVIIICKIHGEFQQNPVHHYITGCGCPKCANKMYSKMQILWLDFLSKFHNIHILHALNDGEFLIPNTNYKADGYCKENNTIYEFHGDFWHGNPKIYKGIEINKITNCTYNELYEKTLIRENKIKELGYNLKTIWENDWKKINKAVRTIQRKFLQNR